MGSSRWTLAAAAMVIALAMLGCRGGGERHGEDASPPTALAATRAPDPDGVAQAARTRADELVQRIAGPRPFSGRTAALVVARGARGDVSPTLELVLVDGDAVVDRATLPTSGLVAAGEPAAEVDESVQDVEGDGAPEVVLDVRYATEPSCSDAGVVPRAGVAQRFVVKVDPVARVALAVQTRYEPRSTRLEARRTSASWEGSPPSLVLAGEECAAGSGDGGACRAVREIYPFDPATRTWLVGAPPARAVPPPCD